MNDQIDFNADLPWVEKYRPRTLSEIASQSMTVQTLQKFIEKDCIPHLIFAGPAGTGKTSTAYALIHDVLGTDKMLADTILERNASDNVRMDTRDEIKNFVNHTGMFQPKYKFVILDEADLIPKAMQGAFRRIIEMAPSNVKFIFMCNYIENIIDPVLSRCAIFRFYPLPFHFFSKQIDKICENEHVFINDDVKNAIFYISQGDMRQAINLLQMAVSLVFEENQSKKRVFLHPDIIYQISGFLPLKTFKEFSTGLYQKDIIKIKKLLAEHPSYSSRGLFRQTLSWILNQKLKNFKKEEIISKIGEYDFRLTLAADPTIQIDGFISELMILLEGIN
ncbi:AAA family ATPase [Candidatus Harpocratesius sp.]